jgi:hypothetical protein
MMLDRGIPFRADRNALHASHMRSLTRGVIAVASRQFETDRNGGKASTDQILKRRNWGDDRLAGMWATRATTSPAMTTTTGWAAELAQMTQALLAHLTPQSAGAQFLANGHSLSFDGAASIMVPSLSGGAAAWISENTAIRVVNFLSSAPTLTPHKLAASSVLTQEMIASSNAEDLVKTALVDACASAIDSALFSATAASAAQPAGILVGATGVAASAATDKLDAMGDDLGTLAAMVATYAGNGSIMYAAAPQQAVRARLYTNSPYPVLMSSALAAGSVVCAATNALASVVELPTVDVGYDASLHMEDTNPQTPTSSPSRSLFQTGAIALKIRLPISWITRNAAAVAYLTGSTKW